jgi:hypothetical protein
MQIDVPIKIQLDNRIYKIFKPKTYQDLRIEFSRRFKLRDTAFEIVYLDNQKVEITIESEDDYQVSRAEEPPISKFYLKVTGEKPADSMNESFVTKTLVQSFGDIVDASMLGEHIDELQTIVENNDIPCYECFENEDVDKTVSKIGANKRCKKCDGSGLLEKKNAWTIITMLVELKLKQYLIDPLRAYKDTVCLNQVHTEKFKGLLNSSAVEAKLETQSTFQTVLPQCLTKIDVRPVATHVSALEALTEKSEYTSSISKSQTLGPRFQAHISAEGQMFLPNNPYSVEMLSKPNEIYSTNSPCKLNPLSFLLNKIGLKTTQNTPADHSTCRFELCKTAQVLAKDATDTYNEVKLEYCIPSYDVCLVKKNQVEVKIFIENKKKDDWPENVKIVGKPGCKLTQEATHCIKQRLKASSRIGVKFSYEINENDLNKEGNNVLEFQFTAVDHEMKQKYLANFSIPLQIEKKKSKLWLCNYIS